MYVKMIEDRFRLSMLMLASGLLAWGTGPQGMCVKVSASDAALPKAIENSIGIKLVQIPAGEFLMGSLDSEKGRASDEGPQHPVQITRSFRMGAHEVTVAQFRTFVKATSHQTEAEKESSGGWGYTGEDVEFPFAVKRENTWRTPGIPQTNDHPVVHVSWNDAVAFCEWLSEREGKTYRLPTEAEWEYACRARSTSRYYAGDDSEGLAKVGNVADASLKTKLPKTLMARWAIDSDDGHVFTAPKGQFKPNAFGLYDMHGNVWEWCSNQYGEDDYKKVPSADPPEPASGAFRVLRGGSWFNDPAKCRSAARDKDSPRSRSSNAGFRVVMESK